MKVSRIDLADFGSPERLVQGILEFEPDLPIPVPIEDLAQQLDIIGIETLTTEGYEGGLLTDVNKAEGIILVNRASSRQRGRFTTGHELGHFLIPSHVPKDEDGFLCSFEDMHRAYAHAGDRAAEMEVEANRFAAQLLMPTPAFRRDLRRRAGADLEHVVDLARRYDTSREATARRYVDLHDEPCAAVISHNGRILRFYRNKDFPFFEVRNGDLLSAGHSLHDAASPRARRLRGRRLTLPFGFRPSVGSDFPPSASKFWCSGTGIALRS